MRLPAIFPALILMLPASAAAQAPQAKFVLEDGTPVRLVLTETISSADQHKGNLVSFAVTEDVKIGDVIVIPKGALAWGTITTVKSKRRLGRPGTLDVTINKVRLADGERVALNTVQGGNGDSHQGEMAGAMAVTGVFAWPVAPAFLLMHGKDITMPKGTETTAFVKGDDVLDPARFTPEALAPPSISAAPAAATQATSVVDAIPAPAPPAAASAPNTAPAAPLDAGPAPASAAPSNDPGKPQPQ
jgi:hypothetical protein